MKVITFIMLILTFSLPSHIAKAENSIPHVACYADTWLLDENEERLFIIPSSYYARINNLDDNYYYVTFNGVAGKIKKNEVSTLGYHAVAKGTSVDLYTNEEFSDFSHIQLKQHPQKGADCILTIPFGDSYTYLGTYPTESGEKWYFVKYNGINGYVLASRTNAPDLAIETFVPEILTPEESPTDEEDTLSGGIDSLEMKIIIIVGLIVPALAIVVLLFKPHRKKFD